MTTAIRNEVGRIPMHRRMGALESFGQVQGIRLWGGKTIDHMTPIEVIDALTHLVNSNQISIDTIKNATPYKPLAPVAPDTTRIDAAASIASRAESAALDALNRISTAATEFNHKIATQENQTATVAQQVTQLAQRFDRVEQSIGAIKIDDAAVTAAVNKVVADAFAPFKQAVENAGAQQVVADLSSVFCKGVDTVRNVFGIDVDDAKGNPLTVTLWNAPDAPAIDPNFVWSETILKHLILADDKGNNVWFGGEKGTGKSETARQFAARTGRSFKRINFHKYTTTEDYAGAVGLVNGNTVFTKGDFLTAFTSPSTVILLDEITNADPAELATLNGFLEPNSSVSFGGSVHRRASGVLVFAADNTLGSGDDTGRYAGTRSMNASLVDRFAQVIRFDFLPITQEIDAVMRHTGCNKTLAHHVLKAVGVCRAKVQTADIVDAPSIRSVIAFINALPVLGVDAAWDACIADRQPTESATALQAIKVACIDHDLIKNNI